MLRRANHKLLKPLFRASYVNNLHAHWSKNPESVPPGWNQFFQQTIVPESQIDLNAQAKQIELLYRTYYMFRMFFISGHLLAKLDPLSLSDAKEFGKIIPDVPDFSLEGFGFKPEQLDQPIYFGDAEQRAFIYPFMRVKEEWTVREIYQRLQQIYSGNYGIEYIHIVSQEEKHWIESEMDRLADWKSPTPIETWRKLARVHEFNEFLKNRFTTSKRFGVEGTDTLIIGLEALVEQSSAHKVDNIIMGMAHRGRLSTLANVFKKPLEIIFAEFQNKYSKEQIDSWGNIGDVKYHLGVTRDVQNPDGHAIRLTMLPNPSHLEAVNPVVQGKTRALQDLGSDKLKSLGIIIHGDAAMAGQGIVYEQLQMQNLKGYSTDGIIHVVANNQIGFTTVPKDSRSSLYCTDVAKGIDAPVIHVNADDPELVEEIFKIAVRYRQQFRKDIVIDLIGYRRYGHNEQDQPLFTQPKMYDIIQKTKPVFNKYNDYLKSKGVITPEFEETEIKKINGVFESAYKNVQKETFDRVHWIPKPWEKVKEVTKYGKVKDTGISLADIHLINEKINQLPVDLNINPIVKKLYEGRKQSLETGKGIDMATAEQLAFGSLLLEGFSVRLSGQDCERGTFSHRHSVINDQRKDIKYYPLRQLLPEHSQNRFEVYNSHLSEYGVLGFEYGYSQSNPNVLTCWEAQFGDFANGAQIMIDNFITSGEAKWNVPSGLVMMLPHGMDGQGPEHSSARMERFLQLMDDDSQIDLHGRTDRIRRQILDSNFQVCVCSNPAQYFHSLRRQLRRDFRKPLILFNSKKLLKYAKAASDLNAFLEGTRFHRLIADNHQEIVPPSETKKVVICYGQVYYDILEKRKELKQDNVAIIRIEQIAPFPYDHFKETIKGYSKAEFIYCQEEHQNSGAWQYLEPRIQNVLNLLKDQKHIKHNDLHYVGRRPSASTASGSTSIHKKELEKFLNVLFS